MTSQFVLHVCLVAALSGISPPAWATISHQRIPLPASQIDALAAVPNNIKKKFADPSGPGATPVQDGGDGLRAVIGNSSSPLFVMLKGRNAGLLWGPKMASMDEVLDTLRAQREREAASTGRGEQPKTNFNEQQGGSNGLGQTGVGQLQLPQVSGANTHEPGTLYGREWPWKTLNDMGAEFPGPEIGREGGEPGGVAAGVTQLMQPGRRHPGSPAGSRAGLKTILGKSNRKPTGTEQQMPVWLNNLTS